jgi:hypothetical protein
MGLLLCCSGSSAVRGGVNSFGQSSSGSIDVEDMQRRMNDLTPDWVQPVSIGVTTLQALLAITVIVLLALPAAHPFFRKAPAGGQWTPPYPTYPTA